MKLKTYEVWGEYGIHPDDKYTYIITAHDPGTAIHRGLAAMVADGVYEKVGGLHNVYIKEWHDPERE